MDINTCVCVCIFMSCIYFTFQSTLWQVCPICLKSCYFMTNVSVNNATLVSMAYGEQVLDLLLNFKVSLDYWSVLQRKIC